MTRLARWWSEQEKKQIRSVETSDEKWVRLVRQACRNRKPKTEKGWSHTHQMLIRACIAEQCEDLYVKKSGLRKEVARKNIAMVKKLRSRTDEQIVVDWMHHPGSGDPRTRIPRAVHRAQVRFLAKRGLEFKATRSGTAHLRVKKSLSRG